MKKDFQNKNWWFRECKAKATEPPCPQIRKCGNECCERDEYCDKKVNQCAPIFERPVCPFDRKCGSVCCPEDEFCNTMSMPMQCKPRICPITRQCEDKCCKTNEFCLLEEVNPPK